VSRRRGSPPPAESNWWGFFYLLLTLGGLVSFGELIQWVDALVR
jgi:hypothetical protein